MTSWIFRCYGRGLAGLGACMAIASAVHAQQGANTASAVSERIQALMSRGGAAAARRAVDSVLVTTAPSDPGFGVALYWRATLVSTPDSARRDLLRVVVEYPLSPYMEDALIRLADNGLRTGDRATARRHLERLVRDHLATDRGARAAHQLAQMIFDDGDTLVACDVLDSARAHVSRGNVELTNQIEYAGRGCESARAAKQAETAEMTQRTRADSEPDRTTGTMQGVSAKGTTGTGGASPGTGRWSVQVAAFAARTDALKLAARLSAQGYAARVTTAKPYRVRIGRFATRAEAGEVAARLKDEKTTAIVVEAERP